MHVAFLTTSLSRLSGGLFVLVRGLAAGLRDQGTTATTLGVADAYTAEDLPAWQPLDARVFPPVGPRTLGIARGYAAALATIPADLVHGHGIWQYPSLVALRWARATGKPYLISPQGMLDPWALRNAGWKKRVAGLLYENSHLLRADCFHAVSAAEADAIRACGLKNPIAIIPNGIDLPTPTTAPAPPPWPQNFADGHSVLLFLGRLHPKKGLPELLNAWSQWQRAGAASSTWRLAIAGWDQGGHRDALERQATALGIADQIHFCGPLHGEAKAAAFRNAAAFVLPSHSEGMPAAVLEAWSYQLPVVMTPACNLPEGFAANAAIAIDPAPDAIARGLDALAALAPAERTAMGARGLALVTGRFTWDSLATRTRHVYEWVLGGGTPPPDVRIMSHS